MILKTAVTKGNTKNMLQGKKKEEKDEEQKLKPECTRNKHEP